MKKAKRIIAGILGIAIVLGLFLFYDGAKGDPISEAYAKKRAIAYAKGLYPEQDFKAASVYYDPPFTYRVGVQSANSRDTHFEVVMRHWTDITDKLSPGELPEHDRLVESGWNTCCRMGTEAAKEAGTILVNELPVFKFVPLYGADSDIAGIELCFSDEEKTPTESSREYSEYLPLDQTFRKDILLHVPARFVAAIAWNGIPAKEDLQNTLSQIKEIMEANEMPMAYYNITLTSGDTQENIMESGNVASQKIR